jgi:hypothetical protein
MQKSLSDKLVNFQSDTAIELVLSTNVPGLIEVG